MPRTRTEDPSTSFQAAFSVQNISQTQHGILEILRAGAKNDEQLVDAYNQLSSVGVVPYASASGVRSRRAELVDMGWVEDTGDRVKMRSGRMSIVWRAVF